MSIVIVSRSNQMSERVKIGLSYEGLILRTIDFVNQENFWDKLVFNYEAIIFVMTSEEELELIQNIANIFSHVFVITRDFNFFNLDSKLKNVQFYSAPLNYRLLADQVRELEFQKNSLRNRKVVYLDIVLDLDLWEAHIGKKKLNLRNKEFILLKFLIENRGRVLTRMNIIENVWDVNADVITNTVDVHMSKLRRLFKKFKQTENIIQTIHSVGYIFK